MATSIRIAPELEERIDFLAKETHRTKAYYLRLLVSEANVMALEDYYLSTDVLERIRQGKEKSLTSEEVRKRLGLET